MDTELRLRQKIQTYRLQENLKILRMLAGWSLEDLADRLGCTKQSISLLEKKKNEMSFIQCIAIRTVLEMEAEELEKKASKTKNAELHAKSKQLKNAIIILLDTPEDQVSKETRAALEAAARAAKGGVSRVLLNQVIPIATVALGVAVGGSSWLLRTLSDVSTHENESNEETPIQNEKEAHHEEEI